MPEHTCINNTAEVRTPRRFRFHPAQQKNHPSRPQNVPVPNRRLISFYYRKMKPDQFIYGALNKHYLILAFQERCTISDSNVYGDIVLHITV